MSDEDAAGGHDHDDHGGHGDADETFADPRPRVRAIQSLLVEKGMLSTDAIDEAIAAYEHDVGPQNGARVVARAWSDPAFKQRLLETPSDALAEFDFEAGTQHVQLKENTADTHNAVVCTLCSCYPWSLLGLPPTWYKTPSYRSRMVKEPRAVLSEFDVGLDDSVSVDVWDSSSEIRYMVLPQRPPGTEDYDEDELADLVTRDAMIGVERLDSSGETDPTAADGGETDPESGFADLLGIDAEPTFDAPWQARAFGATVALYDEGATFDWSAFQRRLIEEIETTTDPGADDASGAERIYYEQWGAALERLLVTHDVLGTTEIDDRAAEFAAGDRTAAEFVEGERGH